MPVAGDSLFFGGSLYLTTNNNNFAVATSFAGITFNSGAGAFTLGGNGITLGGDVTNSSTNLQTISLNMVLSADRTFTTTTGGDLTLSGVLSDAAGVHGIIKAGAGTLTVSGTNTFTGSSTINGGTVLVNSAANLGTGSLTINAGTLEIATGYSSIRNFTMGDVASTFQIDPSQTFTATGIISGTGSLNKTGTGTMLLSGVNSYTGATNVSAGTLQISANDRIANTSDLTVSGGTFDLQTFSETLRNVTLSSGSITGTGAATLTGSTYNVQSGTAGAILAGTGSTMTKTTAGTVTLTGANTFTGATTVSGGTLILATSSGSALGSTSAITLNSGGTLLLGANNQINDTGTMTLAGGTFAKGNFSEGSTSTAGAGALTLSATGSHLDFGTGTVGTLTFASFTPGIFSLTIDNWTGTLGTVGSGTTDRLIFASDQSANLTHFSFTGFASGATEFSLGGGYWEVTPVAPVPEPSTYVAGALALGALVYHQRKRLRRRLSRRLFPAK
jgi:autotransporter-associated beta strand protein